MEMFTIITTILGLVLTAISLFLTIYVKQDTKELKKSLFEKTMFVNKKDIILKRIDEHIKELKGTKDISSQQLYVYKMTFKYICIYKNVFDTMDINFAENNIVELDIRAGKNENVISKQDRNFCLDALLNLQFIIENKWGNAL